MSRTKRDGKFTEPRMPPNPVVRVGNIEIRYHLGFQGGRIEHGPPHLHVVGGGTEKTIGQNGFPTDRSPQLTSQEREIVQRYKRVIRRAVYKIARWHWFQKL
jgi:hypothetical protein